MLGQKATATSMNYLNRVKNQPGEIMTLEVSINSHSLDWRIWASLWNTLSATRKKILL
jgi:hypothetical protein